MELTTSNYSRSQVDPLSMPRTCTATAAPHSELPRHWISNGSSAGLHHVFPQDDYCQRGCIMAKGPEGRPGDGHSNVPAVPEPKPQPVDLLNTTIAQAYTHVHPILVLGIFYHSFSATVQDPVESLAYLLLPLAALQAVYVTLCVPASSETRGPSSTSTPASSKGQQSQRKKQKPMSAAATIASRLVVSISSSKQRAPRSFKAD